MDPTRSRRKISAGLSVGRAFHPIIAVNRFASFFFFLLFSPLPFSLSLSLSLPLAELSRIASRRYIRSRVKPAPLSLSLPIFLFPSRPVPGRHQRVSPFHPSGWELDRASFSYYVVFVSKSRPQSPLFQLARLLSFIFPLLQPRALRGFTRISAR